MAPGPGGKESKKKKTPKTEERRGKEARGVGRFFFPAKKTGTPTLSSRKRLDGFSHSEGGRDVPGQQEEERVKLDRLRSHFLFAGEKGSLGGRIPKEKVIRLFLPGKEMNVGERTEKPILGGRLSRIPFRKKHSGRPTEQKGGSRSDRKGNPVSSREERKGEKKTRVT